jgi:hypothetical protein
MHIMTMESELRLGSGLSPGRQDNAREVRQGDEGSAQGNAREGEGLLVPMRARGSSFRRIGRC